MDFRKVPEKAPCPCGSGTTYEECCLPKGIQYIEDDEGNLFRRMVREAGTTEIQDQERRMFMKAMEQSGMRPSLIYAFERTGLLWCENRGLMVPADLAAWDAAVEEYERLHRKEDRDE